MVQTLQTFVKLLMQACMEELSKIEQLWSYSGLLSHATLDYIPALLQCTFPHYSGPYSCTTPHHCEGHSLIRQYGCAQTIKYRHLVNISI